MAGGNASIKEENGRRRLFENHRFCDQLVTDLRPQLHRERCEIIEFHCMLARREVLQQIGLLDEGMLSTREHVDLCLTRCSRMAARLWFGAEFRRHQCPGAVVCMVRHSILLIALERRMGASQFGPL